MDLKQTVEDPTVESERLASFTPPEPSQNGNGHLNGNGQLHREVAEEEVRVQPYNGWRVRAEALVESHRKLGEVIMKYVARGEDILARFERGEATEEELLAFIGGRLGA